MRLTLYSTQQLFHAYAFYAIGFDTNVLLQMDASSCTADSGPMQHHYVCTAGNLSRHKHLKICFATFNPAMHMLETLQWLDKGNLTY